MSCVMCTNTYKFVCSFDFNFEYGPTYLRTRYVEVKARARNGVFKISAISVEELDSDDATQMETVYRDTVRDFGLFYNHCGAYESRNQTSGNDTKFSCSKSRII